MVDDQPYLGREYIGASPKPGSAGYGSDMIDSPGAAGPQGYLVIQPPGSVTRPHFHQTNQFQVFVGGSGRVGKLRADPVTVQYAGANTPYGPIHAEGAGIDYFTLRQNWESGAKYLPERNDLLVKGRQRQVLGTAASRGAFSGAGVVEEAVFEPADDGLMAVALRLAPGATMTLPDARDGGGQYHVVLSGALRRGGEEYGPLSVEFASPEEGSVAIEAGAEGVELLVLRFARVGTET
jgi:hypothetical protein